MIHPDVIKQLPSVHIAEVIQQTDQRIGVVMEHYAAQHPGTGESEIESVAAVLVEELLTVCVGEGVLRARWEDVALD